MEWNGRKIAITMKEVGFNSGDVLSLSFVVSVAVIVIVGNSMH